MQSNNFIFLVTRRKYERHGNVRNLLNKLFMDTFKLSIVSCLKKILKKNGIFTEFVLSCYQPECTKLVYFMGASNIIRFNRLRQYILRGDTIIRDVT